MAKSATVSVQAQKFGGDEIHPIDIVEAVAAHHEWDFDRLADDQIAMVVEGQWRSYSLTLAWSPREEVLRRNGRIRYVQAGMEG